jgi:hypothetical protein
VAGLNPNCFEKVAEAIDFVVRNLGRQGTK